MPVVSGKRRKALAEAAARLGSRLAALLRRFADARGDLAAAGINEHEAIALRELFASLAAFTEAFRARRGEAPAEVFPGVETDWRVNFGKPRLAGTRIFVALLFWALASGETFDEILDSYPTLSEDHLAVVLDYGKALAEEARREVARQAS